jgi:tetratricopeptide (TPR) repeat protein
MRAQGAWAALFVAALASNARGQQASAPATGGAPAASAPATGSAPAASAQPANAQATSATRESAMRAYHAALVARRLGSLETMRLDDVRARLAESEALVQGGRLDEAIARLSELVTHPSFEPFAENEEGRAAVMLLGDALATVGAYDPARATLRKVIATRGAWEGRATYAHRAVRRLADVALETERYQAVLDDLKDVPPSAPEETRGEVQYLNGRAHEAAGDPEGALAAYAQVTTRSRFWSQATYLRGLINVERGRMKEGEDLFCKVADPKRQDRTAPVLADERFFAVRDLARLALGRVAHEQSRFDDARYYYYLVPRDSDRLAEALYEAATTRYEKKDYEGARELLDELKALQIHHRYEDEAWILDAYIDLAQCKFPDADKKLVGFIARYEPVRDAARRVATDARATEALLTAARTGSDAGGNDIGVSVDAMRAIAALVRLDPTYGQAARRRAIADHEASGLRLTMTTLGDTQRSLATSGGVRPAVAEGGDPAERLAAARAALDGVKRELEDARAARAPAEQLTAMQKEVAALEARLTEINRAPAAAAGVGQAGGVDLPDLLRADAAKATELYAQLEIARRAMAKSEAQIADDAMKRLDLRLSRLLRRARLGRIESVLGRKRALEVEIEAINSGILPQDAVDSLDAARFLSDKEEYWPFEGDDWPDEFVGGEAK